MKRYYLLFETGSSQKLDSCSKQSLCLHRAITMKLAPDNRSFHFMNIESFRLHELHCYLLPWAHWTIGLDSYSVSAQIVSFATPSGSVSLLVIYKEGRWHTRVFSSVPPTLHRHRVLDNNFRFAWATNLA
jgi:hypothetical protein